MYHMENREEWREWLFIQGKIKDEWRTKWLEWAGSAEFNISAPSLNLVKVLIYWLLQDVYKYDLGLAMGYLVQIIGPVEEEILPFSLTSILLHGRIESQ